MAYWRYDMKKFLSHIVILLLLVIAPVSFSTDKIPNFDKPATQLTHLEESGRVTNSVARHSVIPITDDYPVFLLKTFYLFEVVASTSEYCPCNPPERAPPLS